ncbi:MAG: sulfite exporter TauE/SafE family protein [Firmicutes bacterium]|nr:sulfite exporter TauE/SafE family protein [Bacillota bacterium]
MKTLIVCLLAGAAAGVGTGFSGLSAVTVISPMLISFLGCPWYEAVGIGLASDVLASASSAVIYKKNDNIDIRNGLYMVASVLVMTAVGSYFSQYVPNTEMSWFSVFASLFMGIRFVVHPETSSRVKTSEMSAGKRRALSVICGCGIGFFCGFIGAGGGLMMLFILTYVLGYELKTAVGMSVFVMTFTALTGAASHFYFGDISEYIPVLLLCMVFTLAGAVISSGFANKMKPENANRATGVTLLSLGVFMVAEMIL